jgi:hypothetical protein
MDAAHKSPLKGSSNTDFLGGSLAREKVRALGGDEGDECLAAGLHQAGKASDIERRPVERAERNYPMTESTDRKKSMTGVELILVSHFVNSIAPLRTNGSGLLKLQ